MQTAVFYLDEAVKWSKDLTRMRSRCPGDTENAMRSIERDYGVDYWLIWRLRYRRSSIRDIGVHAYMILKAAYQAECERQVRKLEHEIAITTALAGSASAVVDAAKALVAQSVGEIDAGGIGSSDRNRARGARASSRVS